MTRPAPNPNFINGVPELLVLRLLEQEEMYGYQLVRAIHDRTNAVIGVGEGVLYPLLHSLEDDGSLKSRRRVVNGRSRIYYSLTRAGTDRLANLASSWTTVASAVHKVLAGVNHA